MRKLLLLLLLPLFIGCQKEDSHTEIWVIASTKGVSSPLMSQTFSYVPSFLVKKGPSKTWETVGNITGFQYQTGNEYVVSVRIESIANPPADGASERYSVEKIISCVEKQSAATEECMPEFEVAIASQLYADSPRIYWAKDVRYTSPKWEPFPYDFEGFIYKTGYETRLRVHAWAEYDFQTKVWQVKYKVVKIVSTTQTESTDLPKK